MAIQSFFAFGYILVTFNVEYIQRIFRTFGYHPKFSIQMSESLGLRNIHNRNLYKSALSFGTV